MIPNFQNSSNKILGSSLPLPAHGMAGARATPSLAAHFAKQNTKFGGGKARAGTPEAFGQAIGYMTPVGAVTGITAKLPKLIVSAGKLAQEAKLWEKTHQKVKEDFIAAGDTPEVAEQKASLFLATTTMGENFGKLEKFQQKLKKQWESFLKN